MPELLKILPKIKDDAGRDSLFRAVTALLASEKDSAARVRLLTDALRGSDAATRPDLLRLLGHTGHPNANRALAAELATAGDRRRDALAALQDWPAPDPTLTDALLAAAASPTDREAVVAAFCQVAPRTASINGAELVAVLRKAQSMVTSAKNREAFGVALAQTAAPEAADYAKELAADPAWAAPAGSRSHRHHGAPGQTDSSDRRRSAPGCLQSRRPCSRKGRLLHLHLALYHQLEKSCQPGGLGYFRDRPRQRQSAGPAKLQPAHRTQLPRPPRHGQQRNCRGHHGIQ